MRNGPKIPLPPNVTKFMNGPLAAKELDDMFSPQGSSASCVFFFQDWRWGANATPNA